MSETQHAVRWPDDGVSRVPYGVYTDPDVYEEEQARIFRGPVWSFVGLSQEIPEPGDYRIVVQVKPGAAVETAAFDVAVGETPSS